MHTRDTPSIIAVLENPDDIGNIGTAIRNVNAFGIERMYIVDQRGSLPKDLEAMRKQRVLSKTSASAIQWSFVRRFGSTEECFAELEQDNYVSIVTSPAGKGRGNFRLDEGDYSTPRLAVWFGNESGGVSDLAVERSSFCVSIPMVGMIGSLNVGTTTGIVFYEIMKQRRDKPQT